MPKRLTVINMDMRDDDEEDNIYQVSLDSPNTEESGTPVSPDPITQGPSEHELTVPIDEPNKTPNPNPPPMMLSSTNNPNGMSCCHEGSPPHVQN